jgi:hypothetical protein
MSRPELFRGYSMTIEAEPLRIPSSGYYDIADLASLIVHQFQIYGRGLTAADITELTKGLIVWADSPAKPWAFTHQDMTVTVRLTERFIGWGPPGPDGRRRPL